MPACWFGYSVFFFNQKTAYELRISDWSSDVCSSDLKKEPPFDKLRACPRGGGGANGSDQPHAALSPPHARTRSSGRSLPLDRRHRDRFAQLGGDHRGLLRGEAGDRDLDQIGRASCRERVCQYV